LVIKVCNRRQKSRAPKPPEPKVEIWPIPFEHRIEFCRLWDRMHNTKKESFRLETLEFWRYVQGIVPKGKSENVHWRVQFVDHVPQLKITYKCEKSSS